MIDFIAYWVLGILGCWIFSDAIYSWSLYKNKETYGSKKKQTFKGDHWVRLVRALIAIAFMVAGWYIIK